MPHLNAGLPTTSTHHLQHPELLLLDNAVSRLAERYITARCLTVSQRGSLDDYRADLDFLLPTLAGPARDYAEHVADLARTLLDAEIDGREERTRTSGTHRAA